MRSNCSSRLAACRVSGGSDGGGLVLGGAVGPPDVVLGDVLVEHRAAPWRIDSDCASGLRYDDSQLYSDVESASLNHLPGGRPGARKESLCHEKGSEGEV